VRIEQIDKKSIELRKALEVGDEVGNLKDFRPTSINSSKNKPPITKIQYKQH